MSLKKKKLTLPTYLLIFYFIFLFLGLFSPLIAFVINYLPAPVSLIWYFLTSRLFSIKYTDGESFLVALELVRISTLIIIYPIILFLIGLKIDKKLKIRKAQNVKISRKKKKIILISLFIIILLSAFGAFKYLLPQRPNYKVPQKILENSSDVRIRFKSIYGRFGFKNDKGQVIIPAKYPGAGNFDEKFKGMALVTDDYYGNGKEGAIDKMGNIVVPIEYKFYLHLLSEDLFPVKKAQRWGYMNTSGKLVIQNQFTYADKFSNGMAKVGISSGASDTYFCINHKGEKLFPVGFNTSLCGFISE